MPATCLPAGGWDICNDRQRLSREIAVFSSLNNGQAYLFLRILMPEQLLQMTRNVELIPSLNGIFEIRFFF